MTQTIQTPEVVLWTDMLYGLAKDKFDDENIDILLKLLRGVRDAFIEKFNWTKLKNQEQYCLYLILCAKYGIPFEESHKKRFEYLYRSTGLIDHKAVAEALEYFKELKDD